MGEGGFIFLRLLSLSFIFFSSSVTDKPRGGKRRSRWLFCRIPTRYGSTGLCNLNILAWRYEISERVNSKGGEKMPESCNAMDVPDLSILKFNLKVCDLCVLIPLSS